MSLLTSMNSLFKVKIFFKSFIVFFLLIAKYLNAQITITSSNLPSPGEITYYKVANLLMFNDTLTGPDCIWDFSDINTFISEKVDTFLSPSQTLPEYYIIFNPLVANLAYKNLNPLPFQYGITIEDVYDFFLKKNTYFRKAGFGAKINDITMPIKYDNPELYFNLPLTYGTNGHSVSTFGISIPDMGYYGQTIERQHMADGYGTIITPFGSYNAIRVKTSIDITDTIFYEQLNFGISTKRPTIYEYFWLTNQLNNYVAKVSVQGLNKSIEIYYNPAEVKYTPDSNTISFYPSITNKEIIIITDNKDLLINIRDVLGKIIIKQSISNQKKHSINIESLKPGIYILSIYEKGSKNILTQKIIKI